MTTNPGRRRFTRIPFHGAAHLDYAHQTQPCTVIDLSLKGALLSLPTTATQVPDTCALCLQLSEVQQAEIRMQARIAHREDGLIGLSWESIDLDSLTALRRLLELNTGDGEQMARELSAMLTQTNDNQR